jgi:hypothetical protein
MGSIYFLGNASPFAFQLAKVVIHALNIVLVFWFSLILSKNKNMSLIAAAIFAFHPALAEAVAIFCEIDDMVMATLVLLSVIYYIKFDMEKRRKFLVLSLVSFLLAQLTREPALIALFLILAYDISYNGKIGKRIKNYLFYAAIPVIYFLIRELALGGKVRLENEHLLRFSIEDFLTKAVYYFRDLVVPFDLSIFRGFFKIYHHAIIPVALIGISFLLISFFYLARRSKPLIFLALFIFIILLMHIVPQLSVSRRYLYIPACGFSILFVLFLFRIFSSSRYRKIILASIFLFYISAQMVTLFQRNALYEYAGKIVKKSLSDLAEELPSIEDDAVVFLVGVPGSCENAHCFVAPEWKIRYVYNKKDLDVYALSYLNFNHSRMPYQSVKIMEDGTIYQEVRSSANEYITVEKYCLFEDKILERDKFGGISKALFELNEDLLKNKKIYLIGMKNDKLSLIARREKNQPWEVTR